MTDERLRTDTAERPAVRVPPPPVTPPNGPVPPVAGHNPQSRGAHQWLPPSRHRGTPAPPWIAWVVVAVCLLLAAVMGAWLVVRPSGDDGAVATDPGTSQPQKDAREREPQPEPAPEPAEASALPPEASPSAEVSDHEVVDLTPLATPAVPRQAPPNNDVTGELVTFVAGNLVDGDATTCWRMAGDGTGSVLRFTFDAPVTLTALGLINGYAKIPSDDAGTSFDWYHGNRRVTQVEWLLGGEVVSQGLGDTTAVQFVEFEPIETTSVELRLLSVTPPGTGPTGRDYTALSEVALSGYAD